MEEFLGAAFKLKGNDLYDSQNHKLATLKGSDIYAPSNHKMGTVKDVQKAIDGTQNGPTSVALWLVFAK